MAHSRYRASHDVVIMEPEWFILGIGSVMLLSPWTRNGSFSVSGQSCRCHHGSGMVHSVPHASYAVSTSHPEWFAGIHSRCGHHWGHFGDTFGMPTRNEFQENDMFLKGFGEGDMKGRWTRLQVWKRSIRASLRKDNEFPLFCWNSFRLWVSLWSLWGHLWHANPE